MHAAMRVIAKHLQTAACRKKHINPAKGLLAENFAFGPLYSGLLRVSPASTLGTQTCMEAAWKILRDLGIPPVLGWRAVWPLHSVAAPPASETMACEKQAAYL